MVNTRYIKLFENTGKRLDFTIVDEAGDPVDLTGSSGTMRVYLDKPGQDDADVISKAVTIDDAMRGEVHVDLIDTDTAITVATYRFVLEFDFGGGDKRALWSGTLEILGDDVDRVQQIKALYGLNFKYLQLKDALDWARAKVKSNAYLSEKITTSAKKDTFKLSNYVMDSNFDGVVDASDIEIVEYTDDAPYTVTDLSGNISSITFDHPSGDTFVVMDAEYPSATGFKVEIKYSRGVCKFSEVKKRVDLVEELYLIYRLFSTMSIYKLQQGLPDKTINGVTISFDRQGIEDFKRTLWLQIQNEIMGIKPFKGKSVQIPKSYGELSSNRAFAASNLANTRF